MTAAAFTAIRDADTARGVLARAQDAAATLEAQLARVEALHQPAPIPGATYCGGCEHEWPCPTARIVREAHDG